MTDTQYVHATGFVQFDPRERDANGQKVIDYTIRTPGTDGILLRVTVWPELQEVEINKGDWLAVDGKLNIGAYEDKDGNSRQSIQVTASTLAVVPGVTKPERKVVNAGAAGNVF